MLAYVCTYIHTCMYREKDKKVGKAMYQKQWLAINTLNLITNSLRQRLCLSLPQGL